MKRTIILMASFACFLTMKRGDTHPATTQQVTAAQGTGPVIPGRCRPANERGDPVKNAESGGGSSE